MVDKELFHSAKISALIKAKILNMEGEILLEKYADKSFDELVSMEIPELGKTNEQIAKEIDEPIDFENADYAEAETQLEEHTPQTFADSFPYSDSKLPYKAPPDKENLKYLYDDYLGKVPFSDSMPKEIFKKIFIKEITRKLMTNQDKLTMKQALKNSKLIHEKLWEMYDVSNEETIYSVEDIIAVLHKYSFPTKDTSVFKDIGADGTFKRQTNYEIIPYDKAFDLSDLPQQISHEDLLDAKYLNKQYNKFIESIGNGEISDEGKIILDDFRKITDDDDPYKIKNTFWNVFDDLRYWSGRMRVIKNQIMSKAEYEITHPRKFEDDYPKPNTKEYVETPHPHDERYVMIDDKIAHANVDPKSPHYPQWKESHEHTVDEVWNLEKQYLEETIALEEEIKEIKRQYKEKRDWFASQGVQVKAVDRVYRQLKREAKRKPDEQRIEDEVYARLSNNHDIMAKINALMIA